MTHNYYYDAVLAIEHRVCEIKNNGVSHVTIIIIAMLVICIDCLWIEKELVATWYSMRTCFVYLVAT